MPATLVVIPARMASTRLPGKPLADIAGVPMIVHVWRRAMEANLGRVIVATDSGDIADAVAAVGGEAVMTRAGHPSGSDRIYEALSQIDPDERLEFVINLQGDLPTLDPQLIRACLDPLLASGDGPDDGSGDGGRGGQPAPAATPRQVQIATLAAEITEPAERINPNVVKVIGTPITPSCQSTALLTGAGDGAVKRLRALYFTRASAPHGEGPLYHHIGIYAYRRAALKRFVSLSPGTLEQREKLEQLRALEDGMAIDVAIVDTVPLGVDTAEDLQRAREQLAGAGTRPA